MTRATPAPGDEAPARAVPTRTAALGQVLPAAAVAAVVALALTALSGAETYVRLGLPDPGPVVTYGLPVIRALTESAAVVTVGALLLAAVLVPPPGAGWLAADGYRAVRVASWCAVAWAAGAVVTTTLVVADAFGRPLSEVLTGPVLSESLGGLPTAQAWAASAVLALVCAGVCRAALAWPTALAALALAVGGLLPVAFTGHSSAGGAHDLAVNSLVLHVVAAALWVGGLVAVLVHAATGGSHLPVVLRRFSALALGCWVVLAASGVVNALVRLPVSDLLRSTYGLLVLVKVLLLATLGVIGARHRSHTLPAVTGGSRAGLVRLGGVEVLVMFATLGVAIALGRTPPPETPTALPSRVEALLGYSLDGPLDLTGLLTAARPDLLLGTAAVVAGVAYLLGVRRVVAAGGAWPAARTGAWLGGCAVLLVVTSSGIGAYAPAQLSLHMLQQVAAAVVVPLLLALGSPRRLAGALVRPRDPDEPAGFREAASALSRSALGRAVTGPVGATTVLVAAGWLVDGTNLFDVLVASHPGHLFMIVGMLGAGGLFAAAVLDPAVARGRRAVAVTVALVSHALLGATVLASDRLLGGGWFAQLGLGWIDRAADQTTAGLVLLVGGTVPFLVLLGILLHPRAATTDDEPAVSRPRVPTGGH